MGKLMMDRAVKSQTAALHSYWTPSQQESKEFFPLQKQPLVEPEVLYTLFGLPEEATVIDLFDFKNNMTALTSNDQYFLADYLKVDFDRKKFQVTVELVKPLKGPQHIQIRIDAEARVMGEKKLIHTAYLNVYVSEYDDNFNREKTPEKASQDKSNRTIDP